MACEWMELPEENAATVPEVTSRRTRPVVSMNEPLIVPKVGAPIGLAFAGWLPGGSEDVAP